MASPIKCKIPRMSIDASVSKSKVPRDGGSLEMGPTNSVTGIKELHKYCSQKKIEPPWYRIMETTDFDNRKEFTVECHVQEWSEVGRGAKKKEAKHRASHLLLTRLENPRDPKDPDEFEEGEILEETDGWPDDDNKKSKLIRFCKVYTEGNIVSEGSGNGKEVSTIGQGAAVQQLEEFCFKQKLPSARYDVKEHAGLTAAIFTCKCSVLQLAMRTSGCSQTQAKENAARLLLAKMQQHINILQTEEDRENQQQQPPVDVEEGEIVDGEDARSGKRCLEDTDNTEWTARKRIKLDGEQEEVRSRDMGMGNLYNFCVRMKIPPPNYTLVKKQDISATKTIFTFKCSVLRYSKLGKGLNKKQAKHRAARAVLEGLQHSKPVELRQEEEAELLEEGQLTEHDELVRDEYIKHKLDNNFISYEQKNWLQLQLMTERHNVIATEKPYVDSVIIRRLKELKDEFVRRHAIAILKHVCKEIECTYNFLNIKSATQCTANLLINSTPPWSTFGRGESPMQAKLDSAGKLLIFLKNMTT